MTASSEQSQNPAVNGNDGSGSTRWCAGSDSVPQWWQVDVGRTIDLTSISIMWEFSGSIYNYMVEVSRNNSDWPMVLDKRNNSSTAQTQTDAISAQSVRYVRVTITSPLPEGS